MPRFVNRLKLYDEKVPLFHKYGIEDEIAKIQRRHVPLPEGGSIVIDQTEALVAIDVNSGNFRVEDDAERTAYEMNLRAAKEIARQLRLRDLGGVIVNDFIDMRDERHRRGVERALRDAIKRDRARTKVLRMSAFGLIEMTRQRIRPSLKRSVYEDCPHCAGAGVVKTVESMSIDVMRLLALASHREDIRRINVSVAPSVATYLNNRKRARDRPDRGRGRHDHPHPARGERPRRAPPDRLLRRQQQRGPPLPPPRPEPAPGPLIGTAGTACRSFSIPRRWIFGPALRRVGEGRGIPIGPCDSGHRHGRTDPGDRAALYRSNGRRGPGKRRGCGESRGPTRADRVRIVAIGRVCVRLRGLRIRARRVRPGPEGSVGDRVPEWWFGMESSGICDFGRREGRIGSAVGGR